MIFIFILRKFRRSHRLEPFYLSTDDKTPFWRTLKANGELNEKYPGGAMAQKEKLEAEGHTIIQKGRKNIRYYVKNYERVLFDLI